MRAVIAFLLGFVILDGIDARALPERTHKTARKLDFTHISDYPLDDPRNPIAGRSPKLDFTHISDYPLDDPRNPIAGRDNQPDISPNEPHNKALGKRDADPAGPAPRPRPRPKHGGIVYDDPKTMGMAIDRSELLDISDLVPVSPCGAAKRSLEDVGVDIPIKRMSGLEKAKDKADWIIILNEVEHYYSYIMNANDEMGARLRDYHINAGRFVDVIFIGGINSVFLGAREKTGDIDYAFHTSTPDFVQTAFKAAVQHMVDNRPGDFEDHPGKKVPDPINNAWERLAKRDRPTANTQLSTHSVEHAWNGKYIAARRGDSRMGLMDKMSRLSAFRTGQSQFKQRDVDDAKFLLTRIREHYGVGNRDLTVNDFVQWGGMAGFHPDDAAAKMVGTIKLILGDELPGVNQEIKDRVRAMKC